VTTLDHVKGGTRNLLNQQMQ